MPQIKKILLPVDFSGSCKGAARYAAALAGHFAAELMLLHVVGRREDRTADEMLPLKRAELDAFLSAELSRFATRRVCVTGEDAAAEIEKAALEWRPDLVMLPTYGLGRFRRLLLGSVAAKLLHDLPFPVWTSVHAEQAPSLENIHFRKILCALEMTEASLPVFKWCAWLAGEFGASLAVAHAMPLWPSGFEGGYPVDLFTTVSEGAKKRIAALTHDAGVAAEVFLEVGDPAGVVARAAEKFGADLVVTGRGHSEGLVAALFQNSYSIARDSPCPVIGV